ncbi:MAG TPA: phospholipase D-like domain-containing protein [Vicinamibacterales bacterium]|jgi:phosphatidylserine/phosphatidylglycerophosphate/cardiolipin synthase-like enzyme
MKLIVQPEAGVEPIVRAIKRARRSIDVLIFRLDIDEVSGALAEAVSRGVVVRALTAHANRGGTKRLRKLEAWFLECGVTVSQTADDLVRYHGKMMIVDGRTLHLYGFNFTWLDMRKSRSFGIVTRNKRLVQEATKLFEADCARQVYEASFDSFVVSPVNARERLAAFIKGAKKQLLVYDPKVSDRAILRLLSERAKAGVDIRIIGKMGSGKTPVNAEPFPNGRLHVRAIVRDGACAFVGSQSLRKLELDHRREVGVIVKDRAVVKGIVAAFERDWAETESGKRDAKQGQNGRSVA